MTRPYSKILCSLLVLALCIAGCDSVGVGDDLTEPDQDQLYWVDLDAFKIQRANLDGSGIRDLISGLDGPSDIALDVAGGKMYWSDAAFPEAFHSTILRANLDGSDIDTLFTDFYGANDLALDVEGGKIYWAYAGLDLTTGRIRRANLDGSDIENVVSQQWIGNELYGLFRPHGLALNMAAGTMYWIQGSQIQRNNLDGSGLEALVMDLDHPTGLALDIDSDHMYWTESTRIQRARLDGTGAVVLIDQPDDKRRFHDLALDLTHRKIYWSTTTVREGTGTIQRANLDGTNVETLVTNLMRPLGIALLPVE